jgi:hypothetical protein
MKKITRGGLSSAGCGTSAEDVLVLVLLFSINRMMIYRLQV